ncbi:hypothetical protein LSH36_99g01017 [Paralvinella palmiformis]|uniref:Uncharacterized protein n=1 Tax=Paralvinella palmiformis TaxID=53620 RepID=A0AAD9NBE6_9ANNE|nr:hypothetical protein LSH36_99g01017 [Paralvinella palmiformis]
MFFNQQTNIAVYRVLCTPRTRLGIRRESLTKAGQNWTSRLPNTGCTDTDVMFGFVFVLLTVSLSVGSGDYPPHELEYRIHPIDLYPREGW